MTDWMYVDVKALLRIAQVFDIPIANNIATDDFMIHSSLMNEQYSHQIENFKNAVAVVKATAPYLLYSTNTIITFHSCQSVNYCNIALE